MSDTPPPATSPIARRPYASRHVPYAPESSLKQLHATGYNMKSLGVVGDRQSPLERPPNFMNVGEGMVRCGKAGALSGSIWGIVFGYGMLHVPGVGSVMFAGWIESALAGAVLGGGAAALGVALERIGVPLDSVLHHALGPNAISAGRSDEDPSAEDLNSTELAGQPLSPAVGPSGAPSAVPSPSSIPTCLPENSSTPEYWGRQQIPIIRK